jgi:hypothetical protein
MRDNDYLRFRSILSSRPVTQDSGSKYRESFEQLTIVLEYLPEMTPHGEDSAGRGNVWEPLHCVHLPKQGTIISAAWTTSRLARVINDALVSIFGPEKISSHLRGSADRGALKLFDNGCGNSEAIKLSQVFYVKAFKV